MNILEEKPHVATKTLEPLDVLTSKSSKRGGRMKLSSAQLRQAKLSAVR
jgi:hypothetical protein